MGATSAHIFSMPTSNDFLNELMLIRKRLSSLFDEPHSPFGSGLMVTSRDGCWIPVVDCYETDEKYVITAELPGVSREDIDLKVQNWKVILSGVRRPSQDVPHEKYHRLECASGKFQRTFELSHDIDPAGVEAKLVDGVLRISLPKKNSSSRQIQVEDAR